MGGLTFVSLEELPREKSSAKPVSKSTSPKKNALVPKMMEKDDTPSKVPPVPKMMEKDVKSSKVPPMPEMNDEDVKPSKVPPVPEMNDEDDKPSKVPPVLEMNDEDDKPLNLPMPEMNDEDDKPRSRKKTSRDLWMRCPVPHPKPQAAACRVDADCPLTQTQYKEILWSHIREAPHASLSELLKYMRDNVNNDITWKSEQLLSQKLTTKTQIKSALMKMFETDVTFRKSVISAVDNDEDFAERRGSKISGSCGVQGKCKTSIVTPKTRLFDGKSHDVVFTILDDDKTVTYKTPSGASREVQAVKCTKSNQEFCDRATDVDGVTLRAGVTPIAFNYRIRSDDSSEFVVMNHISARDSSRCGTRVCELNQESCPSSLCTRDEEMKCVPKK
jgi:hypothetical protein